MLKICLFAGTTEGRIIAEKLRTENAITACVATEYGEVLLDDIDGITIRPGRMDTAAMKAFFDENAFDLIVDATHPFAQIVTGNIREAAGSTSVLRVLREEDAPVRNAVYVNDVASARDYLLNTEGNIFITTGSKELHLYKGLDMDRVWARVLPLASSLEACANAGVSTAHIIAAQGPFGEAINLAQLKAINAKYMVTKESGKTGGFPEKISAAAAAGVIPVIIGRPREDGVGLEEALRKVRALSETERKAYIIGIGPGESRFLTGEAVRILEKSDAVTGAASVTACLNTTKPVYSEYLPDKVLSLLEAHTEIRTAAIVMRGDTGFYSGARKLTEKLVNYSPELIPGIPAPIYLAARLGISWDDAYFMSLHGRSGSVAVNAARHRKTFVLTGGDNTVKAIVNRLCEYGLNGVSVTVGENLGLKNEKLTTGSAEELRGIDFDSLSTLYINNPAAVEAVYTGIADEEFIRGETPMTKAEVRAVSMSKLRLKANSVVYDIGSGTGSVSVECALSAYDGAVYAIEKEADALALTMQNSLRFHCDNIVPVDGKAPEALDGLPVPTHAFIGGSSGNLESIVDKLLEKNADVRIVINTVTLESLNEATVIAKRFRESSIVQAGFARSRKAGRYNLMTAQNPVYIVTLQNTEE